MKNEHLIGELEHLGVFLTKLEVENIRKATKRDRKRNKKRKIAKTRALMASWLMSRINDQ